MSLAKDHTPTCSICVSPSHGNGQVEDGEHHGAFVTGEQVSYYGGRDGGVAGLSDSHQSSGEYKEPVILRKDKRKRKSKKRNISKLWM